MAKRGRPPYPDTLTPRQQEVLTLVGEGLSNREIGERLDISRDGVKFHVAEILGRTGLRSRREAAEWQRRREAPAASLGRWSLRGKRNLRAMCRRRRPVFA
jgi:DNA-binding NarL/FixJ family response regulator